MLGRSDLIAALGWVFLIMLLGWHTDPRLWWALGAVGFSGAAWLLVTRPFGVTKMALGQEHELGLSPLAIQILRAAQIAKKQGFVALDPLPDTITAPDLREGLKWITQGIEAKTWEQWIELRRRDVVERVTHVLGTLKRARVGLVLFALMGVVFSFVLSLGLLSPPEVVRGAPDSVQSQVVLVESVQYWAKQWRGDFGESLSWGVAGLLGILFLGIMVSLVVQNEILQKRDLIQRKLDLVAVGLSAIREGLGLGVLQSLLESRLGERLRLK